MRWIVTGARGMLGQDLTARLEDAGQDLRAWDRDDLDITDAGAVARLVRDVDVVVNCAAYTAVDAAESDEARAFTLNAVGPAHLARAARRAGARIVHVSTDYVFDGRADRPYPEDAPIAPASAYGRTKAAGEWAVRAEAPDHLIVRTAWLYGAQGGCFPKTIAGAAAQREHLDVVDDQLGQPTWTVDVADVIWRLVEAAAPAGVYHATSQGTASWFAFARAAVASAGLDPQKVRPTTSEAFVRPAPRPAYSVLGHDEFTRAGIAPIGPWEERWTTAAPAVLGLLP